MIGQWENLFTPSTPFLMTPSSGESIGLAALRKMRVFQANRSSTFVWRGFPSAKRIPYGDLTANYNGIPRSYYRFGASRPHVRESLLVIQEQDGDPFAVMMPTTEIIRFYYAPSARLA
jgi:hypothetical protein